jgi:hypothetical protein
MPGKVRVASQLILRGSHDAAALPGWQSPGGILFRLPPLDLDEGEPPASERHEVDLADRGFVALCHDAVASQAKQERRERLRE